MNDLSLIQKDDNPIPLISLDKSRGFGGCSWYGEVDDEFFPLSLPRWARFENEDAELAFLGEKKQGEDGIWRGKLWKKGE
jgi:hypothetical protein